MIVNLVDDDDELHLSSLPIVDVMCTPGMMGGSCSASVVGLHWCTPFDTLSVPISSMTGCTIPGGATSTLDASPDATHRHSVWR